MHLPVYPSLLIWHCAAFASFLLSALAFCIKTSEPFFLLGISSYTTTIYRFCLHLHSLVFMVLFSKRRITELYVECDFDVVRTISFVSPCSSLPIHPPSWIRNVWFLF